VANSAPLNSRGAPQSEQPSGGESLQHAAASVESAGVRFPPDMVRARLLRMIVQNEANRNPIKVS